MSTNFRNNKFTKSMDLKNIKKDQLINKIQELQTESDKNKNKSLFLIIIDYLINYKNWLLKLTLISYMILFIRKYSLFKKFWSIISMAFTFVFGISLYDIYGWNLFNEILNFIRQSWLYEWFSTLLTSKENNQEIEIIKENILLNENKIEDNKQELENVTNRYWETEMNEISNIENNRNNLRDYEIDKPFYYNKYFIIGLSIITLSLIYYYWENITNLFSKDIDPGSDSGTIRPDIIQNEIELQDNSNLNFTRLEESHEKLSKETFSILQELENHIKLYETVKDNLQFKDRTERTLESIRLFENLKFKYIENVELLNNLKGINVNNTDLLKPEDEIKLLKNLGIIEKLLSKCFDIIPEYDLKLTELPLIDSMKSTSSELIASTSDVQNLNSQLQEEWNISSPPRVASPSSDTTIKPLDGLSE